MKDGRVLSRGRVQWVIASGEWSQEGLRSVEEPGEHLATGECRKEVVLVAFNNGRSFVPKVVAVEECMVDGEAVAAVRTHYIVSGVPAEAGGVCGVKCVSCDDLECGGLVGT